MKTLLLLTLSLISLSSYSGWDNPAILCPEEILPRGFACPDLTQVKNPYTDLPSDMTEQERFDWTRNRASDLKLCQNKEVLRREELYPGSFSPLQIQIGWMIVEGGKNASQKLQSILAASQKHTIPPHVLIGALTQESLLASLGISPDGGNYSCGIAQMNIQEWCTSLSSFSISEKERLGWPSSISCSDLPSTIIEPFYEIARTRLGNRPAYQITASDFLGISQGQVAASFPPGNEQLQSMRFRAITSFLKHCQDPTLSIPFKAQTLKGLFNQFVPVALKNQQVYKSGQTFNRRCASPYPSKYYPLHTGWLIAVASYNAGPRQTQLVEHYFQVSNNDFPELTPLDLIEALHWGGRVQDNSTRVYYTGQNQRPMSQTWYKSCVVQRHTARVVQHVTIPGQTLARSLEQVPCSNGPVPKYRRDSSGVKWRAPSPHL
jgi:hypothetical protein